jgi:hypothetical protein
VNLAKGWFRCGHLFAVSDFLPDRLPESSPRPEIREL